MKKTITTFTALGGLLLSGCATFAPSPIATPAPTETPAPTLATIADDIIGLWQLGSGNLTVFFLFNEDGTFLTAQRVVTNLHDTPQQLGQDTLEGGVLTLVNSDESPSVQIRAAPLMFACWNKAGLAYSSVKMNAL